VADQGSSAPLIVGLGEAMLRLSAAGQAPLVDTRGFAVHVAGTELNLLITASALGARGRWLTRLPGNDLGVMMRRHAQSRGIEVRATVEPEGRAGLFFLESGIPPRPSKIVYDRRGSAASHLSADDFDWTEALDGASVAHVSGITCALGAGPMDAVLAYLRAARSLGIVTSFDVNYRSRLWGIDEARAAFERVLPHVDVLFVAPGDLSMLGGSAGSPEELAAQVRERFKVATMVLRERRELADDVLGVSVRVIGDAAAAEAAGHVVDELGAGDAAAGAFLSSMATGESNGVSVERCARAYARMLTIPGDSWSGTLDDLSDGYVTSRRLVR